MNINKKILYSSCITSFTLFLLPASAQDSMHVSVNKPNVVLIVSSNHGRNDLGCYGNNVIKTPNLDRLAAAGIRMTYAYSTSASSSAGLSAILTGIYSHANGQYGQAMGYNHFVTFPEVKSLPQYLKEVGYQTARIGKFQIEPESVYAFDTILGINTSERSTYEMANECANFINAKPNTPFFLYFGTADPSRSGIILEDSASKPDRFGNRDEGYQGIIPKYYLPEKMKVPSYLPDIPACRAELAQYAQAVSRMDLGIGRLFELLRKSGNWENALVIYLSDNGIAFPGSKTTLYNPNIHQPCIVKPPFAETRNQTCDAMVNWADITPTILDFCAALPSEIRFQGSSFKLAINEEHPKEWNQIYASHTFNEVTNYYPMRAIQNRQFKLIWNIAHQQPFPFSADLWASATWQSYLKTEDSIYGKRNVQQFIHRPEFELYDIINDTDEIINLSDNPQYFNILKEMKLQLKDFQVRTSDPWILKWNKE